MKSESWHKQKEKVQKDLVRFIKETGRNMSDVNVLIYYRDWMKDKKRYPRGIANYLSFAKIILHEKYDIKYNQITQKVPRQEKSSITEKELVQYCDGATKKQKEYAEKIIKQKPYSSKECMTVKARIDKAGLVGCKARHFRKIYCSEELIDEILNLKIKHFHAFTLTDIKIFLRNAKEYKGIYDYYTLFKMAINNRWKYQDIERYVQSASMYQGLEYPTVRKAFEKILTRCKFSDDKHYGIESFKLGITLDNGEIK